MDKSKKEDWRQSGFIKALPTTIKFGALLAITEIAMGFIILALLDTFVISNEALIAFFNSIGTWTGLLFVALAVVAINTPIAFYIYYQGLKSTLKTTPKENKVGIALQIMFFYVVFTEAMPLLFGFHMIQGFFMFLSQAVAIALTTHFYDKIKQKDSGLEEPL